MVSLYQKCSICYSFPSLYEEELMPVFVNNRIMCKRCSNEEQGEIPEEYYNAYKSESLNATCDHVQNDEQKAGYGLDKVSLIVHCRECNKEEILNLRINPPRLQLENIISTMINDPNLPKEQIRLLSIIDKNEDVNKILYYVRKAKAYIIEGSMCFRHFKETIRYNIERNEFNCDKCQWYNQSKNLCILEEWKEVVESGLILCRQAKTGAFTSSIIKLVKAPLEQPYPVVKNFLYDLKELKESIRSSLTGNSICLQCEQLFSFSSPPVWIHDTEHHEICHKCYMTSQTKTCPICYTNFPAIKQIHYFNSLYEIRDSFCCTGHRDSRFSYFRQRLPYLTPCNHNVCSTCYSNQSIGHYVFCFTCEKMVPLSDCKLNDHMKQKLKFIEIICTTHNEPANKYFFDGQLSILCEKCPQAFRRGAKTLMEFVDLMNQKLKEVIDKNRSSYGKFFDVINFIPLQIRMDLILDNTKNYQYLKRANNLYPNRSNSFSYWFDNGSKNTLVISSTLNFTLCGFIFGMKKNGEQDFKISLSSGNNISYEYQYEEEYVHLYFNEPIEIKSDTFFDIYLSKGIYLQTLDEVNMRALNNLTICDKFDIGVRFTTKESGDMNFGGPFIGIITENYAWIKHD